RRCGRSTRRRARGSRKCAGAGFHPARRKATKSGVVPGSTFRLPLARVVSRSHAPPFTPLGRSARLAASHPNRGAHAADRARDADAQARAERHAAIRWRAVVRPGAEPATARNSVPVKQAFAWLLVVAGFVSAVAAFFMDAERPASNPWLLFTVGV